MLVMTGISDKLLATLAGAIFLILPATSVRAFELEKHRNRPAGFPEISHTQSFPDDDQRRPRGLLPPMGQDKVRQAVEQGEILPLSDIRRRVLDQFGGKIVGVDLARGIKVAGEPVPWVYDIRVLSPEGRVLSVQMDASDGSLLDVRGQR